MMLKAMGLLAACLAACSWLLVKTMQGVRCQSRQECVKLRGQLTMGLSLVVLPSSTGTNRYRLMTDSARIRLFHRTCDPRLGEWTPPQNFKEKPFYELVPGEPNDIAITIVPDDFAIHESLLVKDIRIQYEWTTSA